MTNDGTSTPDPYREPNYGTTPDPYGQPNVHGQYPDHGAPTGPVEQPSSITTAVMLMRIGALLSLLSLLSALLFRDAMRDTVTESLRKTDPNVSSATIDAALAIGLGLAVVFGLLGVGLWLWMASANGKGHSWARIVATIFFAISVLSTLASLAQPQPGLQRILGLAGLVLGAVIMVLLWKKESTAYYNATTASRVMH
jgi:hypothetical protein